MLSKSTTLPNRYAPHSAIICPFAVTDLSRIRSLRGLLPLLELFQHVDGCFYSRSNFIIFERILLLKQRNRFKAAEAATGKGPIAEARGLRPALHSTRDRYLFYHHFAPSSLLMC
jgi:hypothetical protein